MIKIEMKMIDKSCGHGTGTSTSTDQKLDHIISLLNLIIAKETEMAGELDALTAQVQQTTDVEQSAIVLINGIAARIAAAGVDPAALAALEGSLKTSADSLAAAVAANT